MLSLTSGRELSGEGVKEIGRASFNGQQWAGWTEQVFKECPCPCTPPSSKFHKFPTGSSASHLSKRCLGPLVPCCPGPYISFLCVDVATLLVGFLFFSSLFPSYVHPAGKRLLYIFLRFSSSPFHSAIAFIHRMSDTCRGKKKVSVSRRIENFFFPFQQLLNR